MTTKLDLAGIKERFYTNYANVALHLQRTQIGLDIAALVAEVERLENDAGDLRMALGQYARHEPNCATPCNCGLGAVLRGDGGPTD